MSFALQVKGVSKSFEGKSILRDIHLDLPEGSSHVLLGSSGSGKSTLLRILLGLIQPDEGTFTTAGNRVGYIPQDGSLFPHLTARKNISLVAEVEGWAKEKIADRMRKLQTVLNLDDALLDRYPKEISGGQRQRVAVLRATFLDPTLLLLDEPFGALDPITRVSVQDELKQVFKELQKTVLLVTHDLDEARFFGDSITLLREGEVVQQGTYADLVERPATPFVTQFISAHRRWEKP